MDSLPWIDGRPPELWLVAALMSAALGLFINAYLQLRGTTLVSPVLWGDAAAIAVVLAALFSAGKGTYWQHAAYLATVALIAPTLALLGAKRPQNAAWQFIVVTLVGVLSMPVWQAWALGEARPHVPTLFHGLIAAHIFIGIVNYLPTKYFGAALFIGSAQTLAVSNIWNPHASQYATTWLAVSALIVMGLVWGGFASQRSKYKEPGPNRLWRDFRDAYGLVWGLRIAERLNVSAQKHGWPVEFTWGGMVLREGTTELDVETQHRVERELRSHLRRFVSHDWITARLPQAKSGETAP